MVKRMVKRVVIAMVAMVAVLGPEAKAHYYTKTGIFIHSILCSVDISAFPNPTQHPAVGACTVVAAFVESLCRNPGGQEVFGESATNETSVTQEQLTNANVTNKKKGTGHVDLVVSDQFLLNRPDLLCVNPNWSVVAVLIRNLTAKVDMSTCVDELCSQLNLETTFQTNCTLPAVFNLEDNPPPAGTPYVCDEGVFAHH